MMMAGQLFSFVSRRNAHPAAPESVAPEIPMKPDLKIRKNRRGMRTTKNLDEILPHSGSNDVDLFFPCSPGSGPQWGLGPQ